MMRFKQITVNPSQLTVLIFFIFILIGACLLKLPFAAAHPVSWINAFFTATSAMTVTGLTVADTAKDFTLFGQIVIISLIQLGGLGIMSFAVLVVILLRKKIGLKERLLMQQALNQVSLGGIIKLVKNLLLISFMIEAAATLLLAVKWVPEYGWKTGIYFSIFHSISAFNNAGFALWSDNLTKYAGDPIVNIVITFLIIIGGLGFTVLADIWYKRSFKKLSLHSKLMIIGTLVVNIAAAFLIFILEYHNPKTLGNLSAPDKIWASYFQAITTRTAGFNTLDIGSLSHPTLLLFLLLMFVGAGSASTGGGIKLTTFIIILLAVVSFLKGKYEIVVARRSIAVTFIIRSLAIATISILLIFTATFILAITEHAPFLMIVFEVVSAFGTVGISMGLTAHLTVIGKIVIIIVMFAGKLGPLTLAFSLAKPETSNVKYPSEDIITG